MDTGCVDPSPPSPRLLLPCRGLTCGSETSGDPVLVCASSTEGVRMTHELWWGVNMECKKSKGMDISEYSYTAALFFAIHWSHSVSSLEWLPPAAPEMCVQYYGGGKGQSTILFKQYLWSAFHVQGTMQDTRDRPMSKTKRGLDFYSFIYLAQMSWQPTMCWTMF